MFRKKIINTLKKTPKLDSIIYKLLNIHRGGNHQRRQYLVLEKKKAIYLSIPKVACSSIRRTFIDYDVEDDGSIHKVRFEYIDKIDDKFKDYYKFSFTRNPFDRIVSCYESKYHKDKKFRNNRKLYFDSYLFGAIKEDKGFSNFVNRVCAIPRTFADMHFQSQYFLLYKNNKYKFDYIGKFENLDKDFQVVKTALGLEALPHFNKSDKSNWMDYYTLKTARKIYKKFKIDFIHLGYEDEYYKLVEYIKSK